MSDALLDVDAASAILGVPEGTLRIWRYRGEGPVSFKVGRAVRYRREKVERWLQEARTGRGDAA